MGPTPFLHLDIRTITIPYRTMKQSTVFAALTTFVAAQVFDNLPVCSKTCLENGITRAGCALTDIPCACAKADFINTDITPCLQSTCSEQDEEAFRHIVGQICKDYWLPTATGENHLHQNRGDRFTGTSLRHHLLFLLHDQIITAN
jgi:hypothetical protein